jgi:hypothetical protein
VSLAKDIRHIRERTGILLPLLEEYFRHNTPVDEHEDDVEFHRWLAELYMKRERARQGEQSGMFSPSSLGSCLRKVYLQKHHDQLGIVPRYDVGIDANYYFMKGNSIHKMWQYALYKLELWVDDERTFFVWEIERPVMSKRGGHGGTIDAVVNVFGEPLIVDFKGLNVRAAMKIRDGDIPQNYIIQVTDYLVLWNSQRNKPFPIERGLLMVENKGGPSPKYPLALHETEIRLADHRKEVNRRLSVLREYEGKNEIPPPECESTHEMQFASCPFKRFCRDEVREIQRAKTAVDNGKLAVATPSRVETILKKSRRKRRT